MLGRLTHVFRGFLSPSEVASAYELSLKLPSNTTIDLGNVPEPVYVLHSPQFAEGLIELILAMDLQSIPKVYVVFVTSRKSNRIAPLDGARYATDPGSVSCSAKFRDLLDDIRTREQHQDCRAA